MLTGIFFAACQQTVFAADFLLQGDTFDFKDTGKLLLGGFVLAVGAGVAFTIVRFRLRDKKPPTAQFISIKTPEHKE